MVLVLIADRVADRRCVAYASVPTLMRRANASRSAIRDALVKLLASGELVQFTDRRGPRGETVYHLPAAAAHLAEQPARDQDQSADDPSGTVRGAGFQPGGGPDSGPPEHNPARPDSGPGGQIPTPGGTGFRPGGGPDSGPQNPSEPKVNGTESSSAHTTAADWDIDATTHAWVEREGHLARLGEHGLRAADGKWRAHRATWAPRSAAAWAADWRAWIAREHSPGTGRPNLYALPGGTTAPAAGMTRAQAHTAALLAALDEPTGTE
jgi:hypothetical protein